MSERAPTGADALELLGVDRPDLATAVGAISCAGHDLDGLSRALAALVPEATPLHGCRVYVLSDDGRSGFGEVCPLGPFYLPAFGPGARAGIGELAASLIGQDATAIGPINQLMDRALLEGDPHRVIEGMLIAAYAIGATHGYVYVRAEYPIAVEHVTLALEQAREAGLLGERATSMRRSL